MELKAGKLGDTSNFTNSMAEAMFNAFVANLPAGQNVPGNDQTRLMFVAIAQGMVQYLVNNPDAFVITTTDNNGTLESTLSIKSSDIAAQP
jgi:hypothetical protein